MMNGDRKDPESVTRTVTYNTVTSGQVIWCW